MDTERERRIIHRVVRSVQAILAIALLIYPADWLLWKAQTSFGGGMGSVKVSHVVTADLKGNKEAYYPDEGTEPAACSRSLFPQGGNSACWWLRRHPEIVEHY